MRRTCAAAHAARGAARPRRQFVVADTDMTGVVVEDDRAEMRRPVRQVDGGVASHDDWWRERRGLGSTVAHRRASVCAEAWRRSVSPKRLCERVVVHDGLGDLQRQVAQQH